MTGRRQMENDILTGREGESEGGRGERTVGRWEWVGTVARREDEQTHSARPTTFSRKTTLQI